eukprot:scaffold1843_cov87-Cylindrotheca_fusiformis.AAC.5
MVRFLLLQTSLRSSEARWGIRSLGLGSTLGIITTVLPQCSAFAFYGVNSNNLIHGGTKIANRSFRHSTPFLRTSTTRGGAEASGVNRDNEAATAGTKIPFREYGYRSTPFSWEELYQIIVREQNLARLSRSVPQEEAYQLSLQNLKKEWKSTKDFILHSKFQLPYELDPETGKYHVSAQKGKNEEVEPILRVVPNDFPYYCELGIQHWVLWKWGSNASITDEDIDYAKTQIKAKLGGNDAVEDMIYWENPPALKSLPEIAHVHFLVLATNTTTTS